MFELLLCSLLTILPAYLSRRYGQGKRLGKEITLYSVSFELLGAAIVLLRCTKEAMTLHLAEISQAVAPGAHAVVLLDQAGRHCCAAWNKLTDQPWRIMSLDLREWAYAF
jgi:hypothetical protein